jgi:hypothetical protein
VFLHDTVTDLAVALGALQPLKVFANRLFENYRITPGFVTRNFVRFVESFDSVGFTMNNLIVMAPFNDIGFQMIPNRIECEKTLKGHHSLDLVGMSVLAAGQVPLERAISYLKRIGLRSVTIGVSSEVHASDTFTRLNRELFQVTRLGNV